LLLGQGDHVGSGRDGFFRTLNANKGLPTPTGTGAFLTPSFLRLWFLGPGGPPCSSRKPPNSHEFLSFAGSLFLPRGREKVGEDASLTTLLATAHLDVMGRSSRRRIGPSDELWVRLLGQIDPVDDRGRRQHGSDRSAEHTIGLTERSLEGRLSERVIRTSIPRCALPKGTISRA
jgi:hypothetical protein